MLEFRRADAQEPSGGVRLRALALWLHVFLSWVADTRAFGKQREPQPLGR